jgi:hypothetical protein
MVKCRSRGLFSKRQRDFLIQIGDMKLQELQGMIDRRVKAKQTLDRIQEQYDALKKAIEEYGEGVTLEFMSFTFPVEEISINMCHMPSISASIMLKPIGESINAMKQYIKMIDEDLKEIVEFEDEEPKEQ